MATGATVFDKGAGYVTLQASSVVNAGAMSSGARTTPLSAFAIVEEDYIALDFQLKVTSGTPTANAQIKIFRRASEGTNQSPAPTPAYLNEPVDAFLVTNSTGTYYVYGVTAGDPNDEYYLYSDDPSVNLTMELLGRPSSYNAAP